MRRARSLSVRRLLAVAAISCVLVGAWVAAAGGASSSVTVTLSVASSISITNDCTDPAGHRFGTVQPGVPALTSTSPASVCGIEFTSSNDSAMLRASQADGASGSAAMSTSSLAWSALYRLGDVRDVSFAPGTTTGWAVGDGGLVLRSVDGGDSWSAHTCTPCGTQQLSAVSAATANSVFIGGTDGRTYRWDGVAWEALPVVAPANSIVAMDTPDGVNLWLVAGGGYMWKSTNANVAAASVTWTQYRPTTNSFLGVDVVDANVVFGVAASGTVVRTTNGGADLVAATLVSGSPRDVAAVSATSAVIVNSGGKAFFTIDGTSWAERQTGVRELLTDVERNGATVYAASELGRVVKSTNGGDTWTSVMHSVSQDRINALSIVNGSTTVVAGGRGMGVQRTINDGADWNWEYAGTPNLAAVAAVDGQEAFAVGDQGAIVHSTDWGTTWTPQTSPTTRVLRGVALSGTAGDRLIAVGDAGTIVETSTAGTTWTLRTSGTTQRLRGVAMYGSAHAWAVGDGGTILRSTDGGVSWSPQPSGTTYDLHDVVAVSKDVAWAVGGVSSGRIILRTADGGATWTTQLNATGDPIVDVDAVSATHAMAMGMSGRLHRTTDGATWTDAAVNSGRDYAVAMATEDIAYLSYYGSIERTTDGGVTWTSVTGASWREFKGIDAVDPDTVIAVGGAQETGWSLAGGTITDYGVSPNNWAGGSAASLFGICLHDVGASTTAVWTKDTTSGCSAADTDPWLAIPTVPSKVATAGAGATGRAEFVFGVRPASSQPPGSYYASVTFEALAPSV